MFNTNRQNIYYDDSYALNFTRGARETALNTIRYFSFSSEGLDFSKDFIIEYEIFWYGYFSSTRYEFINLRNGTATTFRINSASSNNMNFHWRDAAAGTHTITRPLTQGVWNTVRIVFTHGVEVSLTVNSSSVVNTANATLLPALYSLNGGNVAVGKSDGYGGTTAGCLNAAMRNIKFTFDGVVLRHFKLNQKNGHPVDSSAFKKHGKLERFPTLSELENGFAWKQI